MNEKPSTNQEWLWAVGSIGLLSCGHPGAPNNLLNGKCGTCQTAKRWAAMGKGDKHLRPLVLKMAKLFREGKMIYDTNGKSLLEWEKALSPQDNATELSHAKETHGKPENL